MISIHNLSAGYGKTNVLTGFSLDITNGESYALIGPSGCGKSTLVKILCGIHKEFTGEIIYNRKPFLEQKLSIGYVPQTYGLLDWKTVSDNVFLPLKLDPSRAYNPKEAQEIIEILEIQDLLKRYPLQLSGGQRQRVALARAFIAQPNLLLMDEPFSSLDSFTSARSQELFLRLWHKHNITTLVITHNILEAVNIGKHILLMDKTPGRVIGQMENHSFEVEDKLAKLQQAEKIMDAFKNGIV